MDSFRAVPPDFFAEVQADPRVDTAMLLRRNGRVLAAWSRSPVSWEVVSIMAATMVGSLETMLETLGSASPRAMSVVAGGSRLFLQKVEPQALLVLVARETVPDSHLREAARRLLARVPSAPSPPRQVTLGPSVHEPRGVERPSRRGETPTKNA